MNPTIRADRILFISLAGAGDTLLATPLIREVRTAFPSAAIDVLTMQGTAPVQVLDGNPDVTGRLHFDFMRAGRAKSVAYCLSMRARAYDVSFTVMPQNRLEYNLITRLIGATCRVGFEFVEECGARARLLLSRCVREDRSLHVVENNLRLFTEGLGLTARCPDPRPTVTIPEGADARAAEWAETCAGGGRRIIGFHPGSGTTKNLVLKRWPMERWASLARRLAVHEDFVIALFGSADERPLRDEIIAVSGLPGDRMVQAPDGPVGETAALIGRTACFVCGDTLLTHVAAAVGAPTVEIVGPTDPTATGPYKTPHCIVRLGLSCSPCYFFSKHGIRCTHSTPMACLSTLDEDRVEAAVMNLLGRMT